MIESRLQISFGHWSLQAKAGSKASLLLLRQETLLQVKLSLKQMELFPSVIIDMLTALVNAESSTAAFWLILPENDIERDGWAGVHPLPFLCHK